MAYSRSPPQSMSSHDDWDLRGPMPTTRSYSNSSRSTSHQSGAHSTVSASGRAHSGNTAVYEGAARTYYAELKKFLASLLAKEASEGVQSQRVSARQKLSRLNALQFHELAMDVYDEMMRRNADDKQVPFLSVRAEFHPRRNQARQKLATLPSSRFKDLASDVYHEIARRYSHVLEPDSSGRPPVPPIPVANKHDHPPTKPQASQSTSIVPVKGTVNVETIVLTDGEKEYSASQQPRHVTEDGPNNTNDEWSSRSSPTKASAVAANGHLSSGSASGSESNFQSLDSLMADLGNMVSNKMPNGGTSDANKETGDKAAAMFDKLRSDYEFQLAGATKRCQQLEAEVMSMREKQMPQNSLESESGQLQTMQSRLRQLQEEYNRLDDQHRQLQMEHKDQQSAVDGVREEISHLLEQIKLLSSKNTDLQMKSEAAEDRSKRLSSEVKEWRSKYEKCRMELRTLKAVSIDRSMMAKQDGIGIENEFLQPTHDGVIPHSSIVSYQAAIDDLLQVARSSKPSNVLHAMQIIVMTCKQITEQVESHDNSDRAAAVAADKLPLLKSQFSSSLANLLTAAKNHASSMGISPVSLLDAAASHLTEIVVELVKLLGIRNDRPLYESESSAYGEDDSPGDNSYKDAASRNMSELSAYLKTETDHTVKAIQQLLTALRSPNDGESVIDIITAIIKIVTGILEVCENGFSATEFSYRHQTTLVLSNLRRSKETLLYIRDKSFGQSPETASAAAKRDLAKEAYEIAKYTKELINICEK